MRLRYLLDTNIVSEPMSKQPRRGVLKKLEEHDGACSIAAPVWHELVYGCSLLPRSRRRAALEKYLDETVRIAFPILPYDEAAAAWHGTERARLARSGKPPPYFDGQIAAVAKANGLVLVTANPSDFVSFDALQVENWAR